MTDQAILSPCVIPRGFKEAVLKNIRPEMSISDIFADFPETKELFMMNGLGVFASNGSFLKTLTLASFMKMRELNPEIFLPLLEKRIEACETPMLYTEDAPPVKPDFLGYMVCPVKHLFKESYEEAMLKHLEKTGEKFVSFVPMGCGGADPYEDIWQSHNIDELPDIVGSIGFGSFYRSQFTSRFLDSGYYESCQMKPMPEPFASAGIEDPLGVYTVYAVYTYVILVDYKKLKDLPVPRSWSDLLRPEYKNNIIVGGSDDYISEVLLVNIWKDYGQEGLDRLLPNIRDGWHASQMAKAAGSSMSNGAAIYVLPWFFAKSCPNTEHTEIIWPEDGAMASPMYMLVKKSEKERLKPVIDYMTGKELASIMSSSFFPSVHPEAENSLPEGAKIKWLGWDFIRERDMKAFSDDLNDRFMEKLRQRKKEQGKKLHVVIR